MRAVREERIDITETFYQHMDLCLLCRACETACPSGVQFARVMEATRLDLWTKPVGPLSHRIARRIAFERVLPHRRLFRLLFRGLELYQRSGLQSRLRRSKALQYAAPALADRERLIPPIRGAFFDVDSGTHARDLSKPRVGFVAGCVMGTAFGDVQRASIRVLEKFGCQVVTPAGQGCCGALNVHAGEQKHARRMARQLIESMLQADVDVIVINSAGCGSVMKEYSELFESDPEYLPRVEQFQAKVQDFSEFLVSLPSFTNDRVHLRFSRRPTGTDPASTPVRKAVAYQDACHLRHAQHVVSQPRSLLAKIDGLELVELANPDQCCGSAGTYNLEHPELSNRVLARKVDDILRSGAELVVTGNPGCMMQLEKGLRDAGSAIEVEHIATVLDAAIDGGIVGV
jgi:glycolate oxidase iron-sulfur subunit